MFWNIDVKEQEQDLMAISRFLLSVFEFAAGQSGNIFPEKDWLDFAGKDGAWFYRLYERDTEKTCAGQWTGCFVWNRGCGKPSIKP